MTLIPIYLIRHIDRQIRSNCLLQSMPFFFLNIWFENQQIYPLTFKTPNKRVFDFIDFLILRDEL